MQNITRRSFLKNMTALTVAIQAPSFLPSTKKQPNILWISCEDISPHLASYGEKCAVTPTMDQFAKEGVRFTQAYTVHGVCAPSRSGIITGMYPSGLGSVNMRCEATIPELIKCFPEYLRQTGYYCTNNDKEDYNFRARKTVWDESSKKTHWKNRPKDKPFFAVFNFFPTHESQLWNSADFDHTHPKRLKKTEWQKPENMTVPPIYPDTLTVRRDLARLFERITQFDYFVKDKINELKQAGLYEDTIIFIWSDHGNGLPRAKRWLYDSGTRVPLVIRIPKKYRSHRQALPNTTDDQLINLIDLGPTVLNLAGITIPEHMHGQPFLGDNLPARRKYIFGARQRIDELCDMVRSVRDERYRYIVNFMPFVPYLPYLYYAEKCNTMKEMRKLYAESKLNDVQAQWMADSRPAEELYDLTSDPWETRNLAEDPKLKAVKQHLRNILADWMLQTRDTGLLPEPDMVRMTQELGCEYMIFQQPGSEVRIKQLIRLAFICASPQPEDQAAIETARTSDDPAVRYWAVLAMRNNEHFVDGLLETSHDPNASVRIATAWSLMLSGKQTDVLSVLENELNQLDQQEETLCFAMNVLNYMGPTAHSMMPTIKRLSEVRSDTKYLSRLCRNFINEYSNI